jgi:hypothetical protein
MPPYPIALTSILILLSIYTNIKKISVNRFGTQQPVFDHKRNEEIVEDLKIAPADEKLKR